MPIANFSIHKLLVSLQNLNWYAAWKPPIPGPCENSSNAAKTFNSLYLEFYHESFCWFAGDNRTDNILSIPSTWDFTMNLCFYHVPQSLLHILSIPSTWDFPMNPILFMGFLPCIAKSKAQGMTVPESFNSPYLEFFHAFPVWDGTIKFTIGSFQFPLPRIRLYP
jgi:hypothetical protein